MKLYVTLTKTELTDLKDCVATKIRTTTNSQIARKKAGVKIGIKLFNNDIKRYEKLLAKLNNVTTSGESEVAQ
jgi:hypothetical protein